MLNDVTIVDSIKFLAKLNNGRKMQRPSCKDSRSLSEPVRTQTGALRSKNAMPITLKGQKKQSQELEVRSTELRGKAYQGENQAPKDPAR